LNVKTFDLSSYTLSISVIVALLAGCGGPQAPIGAPCAMSQGPGSLRETVRRIAE
jgi:hypothetical protein